MALDDAVRLDRPDARRELPLHYFLYSVDGSAL
jgi:hypothetical protein